ncbi:MAG: sigma 54-interacting transcriptional regulator [Desulforhopalus sp.]
MLTPKNLHSLCFDASHNGIMVINCEGTILIYNKAAKRIFNFGDVDLVGSSIKDIRPFAWIDMEAIIKTGQPQIGKKIVLPEATIIANRTPIFAEGKIVGVISVFQDVSEHEKIVAQLHNYQKIHKELEAIFESSYDGIYVADGNATTLRVNKSYERITGLSRENLIGKNMESLVADQVFDHSVTLEVLQKKKPITLMQQVKSGKQVIVTGTPIFSENNQISFVVTNVRDISELNELKMQLDEVRKMSSFFYQSLQEYREVDHAMQDLVVKSQAMIRVVQKAIKVAKVEASVLITGESGVGKSMLAKLIHKMSPRKEQPFVKINCGAIPQSLMESELFGYESGAFTGALSTGKTGLIEAAHQGTVFFDEIAELKPEMQVKLLEVIEEKQFKRIGSTKSTTVDVHIIAATNQNLSEQIRDGNFREDLYYRLNVVPIFIPPLRERREDIPALAESILERINHSRKLNKQIEPVVLELLRQYDYPGNVRELINTIERMIILSEGESLVSTDLPSEIRTYCTLHNDIIAEQTPLKEALENYESQLLQKVLEKSNNINTAARMLKIHPTTLWRKMTKFNLLKTSRSN